MNIVISLILSLLLAGFAFIKKALTVPADIVAFCFSLLICFFGGIWAFTALVFTFAFTILAGKISKAKRIQIEEKYHKKKGPRDTEQILCNVATGTFFIILEGITGNQLFYYGYAGAMAASLSDSLASELGILSRKEPKQIFTNKSVSAGMSGGVTAWGFFCSGIGAFLIAAVSAFHIGFAGLVSTLIAGISGALADSIMGCYLQAKYQCPSCGLITEKPFHCNVKGVLVRGVRFISNDTVNFLNNIIGALIAIALGLLFI